MDHHNGTGNDSDENHGQADSQHTMEHGYYAATTTGYDFQFISNIEEFHMWVFGIGAVVVCAVGIVSNIISLTILLRKDMVSTTYTFLTALAFSDITIIITGTLLSSLTTVVDIDMEILVDNKYVPIIFPLLRPAALTCVFTSVWITVALTLDRYLAVCHHGMKLQTWFTVPRARIVVASIVLSSALYNVPTFFEYRVEETWYAELNTTLAVYKVTDLGKNSVYRQLYHSWFLIPLLWGIPFISLTYMNIRLIIAVKKSRDEAMSLGQALPRGLDVTIMLIAIIINFLLCQSPHLVSSLLWALSPHLYEQEIYMKFYLVAVLLVLINSSTNFFVYALFGKKFRRKFFEVYCKCFIPKHKRGKRGSSFSHLPEHTGKPLLTVTEHTEL